MEVVSLSLSLCGSLSLVAGPEATHKSVAIYGQRQSPAVLFRVYRICLGVGVTSCIVSLANTTLTSADCLPCLHFLVCVCIIVCVHVQKAEMNPKQMSVLAVPAHWAFSPLQTPLVSNAPLFCPHSWGQKPMPRPVGILCPLLIVHSGLSPGQTLLSAGVMVHLHCQLDWIWNRQGDTLLWVSLWVFPERLAEEGSPT